MSGRRVGIGISRADKGYFLIGIHTERIWEIKFVLSFVVNDMCAR